VNVGIVVVSHSPKVAEGTLDMVRGMVGDEVACAAVGGDPAGGLGSDPMRIRAAIDEVWSGSGVAVLVDIGGAEMNAEMAIEMLDPDRAALVRICQAPLVEGAVLAAAEAASGSGLAAVCAAAEAWGR
jgi:dihydroxyacetone kinase phosphotransfer subunit